MKKTKTSLLIAIAVMLLLIIVSAGWIIHRGNELHVARAKEDAARAQARELLGKI